MVVDTSALVCILLDEPEAADFARARASASESLISGPTWVEASLVITARLGSGGHALLIELLERSRVATVPCDQALARGAYDAWLQYGRGRHVAGLNFGDYFSNALAKQRSEPLLFKGDDFAETDIIAAVV
ncbi:MAG: type II toxin-antitoxin system VapC family toxin [Chromatiaceae bacterium]|nr:type II toxin-antitoxin system VapC family toxin [Chromatiaceae bacterium]